MIVESAEWQMTGKCERGWIVHIQLPHSAGCSCVHFLMLGKEVAQPKAQAGSSLTDAKAATPLNSGGSLMSIRKTFFRSLARQRLHSTSGNSNSAKLIMMARTNTLGGRPDSEKL